MCIVAPEPRQRRASPQLPGDRNKSCVIRSQVPKESKVPYVKCPECEADCLVIIFAGRERGHSCPRCGASLPIRRRGKPAVRSLAKVREAQARFRSQAAGESVPDRDSM